ncbi:MAG: hypothetical protein M5U29_01130 [Anaerolineae bacterium]|nr:hypothetical protein [Anaerolineae bacterium]
MVAERLSLGDEWRVKPVSAGADRAPVQRVALITEAFLPKVDGVSKLTASLHGTISTWAARC